MIADSFRLGVDFGTSSTVAVLQRADGSVSPLLFDASPLLTSAVFAGPEAELLTGEDANRAAAAYPAGYEANPKRRIDDGTVWLGEREFAVVDLITAVLARVADEASRVAGQTPTSVVMTHPAVWSQTRLSVLAAAARAAGLGDVRFVAEPVAAAAYFATILGRTIPPERCLVVYDLGAGTFDVSVVGRSATGFEVIATDGLADVGGLDLDATVVNHARSLTAGAAGAWGRLDWPETTGDQRASRMLWRDARAAKEQLSRRTAADLHIPLVEADLHLTRDEFEKAARPHLDRTVALTRDTLRRAGIGADAVAGLFLVGGSSRIPLASSLLHRALRIAPTSIEQPELVVAVGSLHAQPATLTTLAAAPAPSAPATLDEDTAPQPVTLDEGALPAGEPEPAPDPPARPGRRRIAVVAAAAAVVLALAVGFAFWLVPNNPPARGSALRGPSASPAKLAGTASLAATLTGDQATVFDVAFSPDGKSLATAGDKTVRLWNVATRTTTANLTGHTKETAAVAFSPDGTTLASGGYDKTVRLWSVATGKATATLTGHTDTVTGIAFSRDGTTMATSSSDKTVRLWDVGTGRTTATLAHPKSVDSIAFSPDGQILAAASEDNTVRLWNVATHKTVAVLADHTVKVTSVAFSPNGKTLATGGFDNNVQLWDIATRKIVATLTGHTNAIFDLAFSPDGSFLASASQDMTGRLWNVTTHKTTAVLTGHTVQVSSVAFSPDGKTLAAGDWDGKVQLWNLH